MDPNNPKTLSGCDKFALEMHEQNNDCRGHQSSGAWAMGVKSTVAQVPGRARQFQRPKAVEDYRSPRRFADYHGIG